MRSWYVLVIVSLSALLLIGCSGESISAQVDREAVQAEPERQIQAEVKPVNIPSDPTRPNYVLVVLPFETAASGVTAGAGRDIKLVDPGPIGQGVAAQLISTFQQVGNISIVEYHPDPHDPNKVEVSLGRGEEGPFVIRGVVTEFNETSDVSGEGKSSGPNPALNLLPYGSGHLINAIKGSKSVTKTVRVGMVAFDFRLIRQENGRVICSGKSQGTFTTIGGTSSKTSFGETKTSVNVASSAIGQATMAATNEAAIKIRNALLEQPTTVAKR